MIMTEEQVSRVGRKKRHVPARVVKLDGDLVTRAKTLAGDVGMDTAQYLSGLLRPIIDREWSKLVKRASDAGE